MTADEFPKSRTGKLIEASKIVGAVMIFLTFIGAVVAWVGPISKGLRSISEFVSAVTVLQDQMAKVQAWQSEQQERVEAILQSQQHMITTQDGILATLDEVTKPKEIFETNLAVSGARAGYCVLGENCGFDIRVRRTPEGVSCTVDTSHARFYLIGIDSGQRIQIFRESGTPITNVGRDWFDYHWVLSMPTDMEEPAAFLYEFGYTHCRSPEDEAKITQESIPIPVELITPNEAIIRRLSGEGQRDLEETERDANETERDAEEADRDQSAIDQDLDNTQPNTQTPTRAQEEADR